MNSVDSTWKCLEVRSFQINVSIAVRMSLHCQLKTDTKTQNDTKTTHMEVILQHSLLILNRYPLNVFEFILTLDTYFEHVFTHQLCLDLPTPGHRT